MRDIKVLRVSLYNFRAFTEETVVFPQSPGLRFLSGENREEPQLGSNGAGKSTLWESVLWGLYGITSKGETISQLVSWEAKELSVEVELSISGDKCVIKREGPPERVYLDGVKVDQKRIDELLGMGKVPFRHAVIFSQKLKLFPDLSIPERGALLEETLGLSQWSAYSKQATLSLSERDQERQNRALILTRIKGRLEGMPLEESILGQRSDWEGKRSFQVSSYINDQMAWTNKRVTDMEEVSARIEVWEAQREGAVASLTVQSTTWEGTRQSRLAETNLAATTFETERASTIAYLEGQNTLWEDQTIAEMEAAALELTNSEARRDALQCQLAGRDYSPEIAEYNQLRAAKSLELKQLEAKINGHKVRIESIKGSMAQFSNEPSCPTCGQPVDISQGLAAVENCRKQIAAEEAAMRLLTPAVATLQQEYTDLDNILIGIRDKQSAEESRIAGVRRELLSENRELTRLSSLGESLYHKIENKQGPHNKSIEMKQAEVNTHLAEVTRIQQEVNPYPDMIAAKNAEVCPHWTEYDRLDQAINPFISRVEEEKKKVNPFDSILEDWRVKRDALMAEIDNNQSLLSEVEKEITTIEFWKDGFKRIRLYLMNKVLRALEVEVNSALSTLGMNDWHVTLPSETETKSGTVKFGVQIIVTSPKKAAAWEAWSGGEEQRLRIGISLGLASLIQRASGSWWNLEVFDEPSIYLSEQGVGALLETLDYRAVAQKKPIWIVDHTALTHVAFKEAWTVVKGPEGSKIERDANNLYN
jgi:DNA repair exonuclease SbcCD ATPase subunit